MPSGHRPQPPVGTARVAISGTNEAGTPWVNVFWLNLTSTTHVAADLKSIVDSMVAAYATRFVALMSSNYEQTGVKASWLYAAGNSLEYASSYANVGGIASAEASDAVCAVVNWSITDFYRGGHPRTYLAGLPQSKITNGRTVLVAHATTLATAAGNFITDCNALTHGGISAAALGTVRFASGNAWLSPPVFRGYGGATVRSILGTQRRRYGA